MLEPIRGVSIDEQQTTVSYERGSNMATIDTTDNKVVTLLNKLFRKSDAYRVVGIRRDRSGNICLYTIEFDKSLLSFRLPRKKPVLSQKQREAKSENMREMRKTYNGKHNKEA